MHLMHFCCQSFVQCMPNDPLAKEEHLRLILNILSRERFRAAWLLSPYFNEDLHLLYSMHLMTD